MNYPYLDEIQDISLKCGDRYTYNGKSVPRVTEILSKMIHEESIVQWANSLGFARKSYRKELNKAANYGTYAHHGIECLLKNKEIPEKTPQTIITGFSRWWDTVKTNNRVKVIGQEEKLSCEWFGGTYDLLLEINDRYYLVDFKTSNHITYKYYMQLAAYNYMLKERYHISGLIVLQLSKATPGYNEYILDLTDPVQQAYFDTCEKTFMSLVYAYYHIHWLEGRFNELFKYKQ